MIVVSVFLILEFSFSLLYTLYEHSNIYTEFVFEENQISNKPIELISRLTLAYFVTEMIL